MKKLFVIALALSTGCAIGPEYQRREIFLPQNFREGTVTAETIADAKWWELFKDPVLHDLIRTALDNNKDLAVALERIAESAALVGVARSALFPEINAGATGQRTNPSDEIFFFNIAPYNQFGLGAQLNWELDIWGKLRRATEAQRAELLSQEYTFRALTISLVSSVAVTYFQLLDIDNQLAVAKRTLENRAQATQVINQRFQKGVVPELDLNQAQIEEADVRASIAALERAQRQLENALAILLGNPPGDVPRGKSVDQQVEHPQITAAFPAALLERRPDILAAEESVKAQVARIGVAQADRLPALSLAGFIGRQGQDTSDLKLGGATTWNIQGGLLGPILDFGRRRAQVDAERARAEQAYKSYEQAAIVAVREVDDALVAIRTYENEYQARLQQSEAARNAARLSRARYDEGFTSYLEVLDIERSLFAAELSASSTKQQHLSAIVQLYRALGGGWSEGGKQ